MKDAGLTHPGFDNNEKGCFIVRPAASRLFLSHGSTNELENHKKNENDVVKMRGRDIPARPVGVGTSWCDKDDPRCDISMSFFSQVFSDKVFISNPINNTNSLFFNYFLS